MAQIVTSTDAGQVVGSWEGDSFVFRGIPYAAPPVGELRFKPPEPVAPWDGTRDATKSGSACPQVRVESAATGAGSQSEDCLVLNVFTPDPGSGSRPVMVWLHGGGFTIGSGGQPSYDGAKLAARGDVVVVSINHRLGALGYLYLAELGGEAFADSGNAGALDMVAALRWVHDNIGSFGGDKDNVTIFGQSGGGGKVSTLLGMPSARGLFHRAIVQSGPKLAGINPISAAATARAIIEQLGLSSAKELVAVPVAELVAAQAAVLGDVFSAAMAGTGHTFGPVTDGRSLPENPFEPHAAPSAADVPLLIGTCKDEWTILAERTTGLAEIDDASAKQLVMGMVEDESLYATYERMRPSATPAELITSIRSGLHRIASIRLAERKMTRGEAPVFMYRFDYESPLLGGKLGAPHSMEIPFVFDHIGTPGLHGDRPDAQALSDRVSEAWLAFARGGDPNHPNLPTWPKYDMDRRSTMLFDSKCQVADDPDAEERLAWEGLRMPSWIAG